MPLKYIFHLSDLHIRNGDASYCRFNEYNAVFKNTIISIARTINNRKLKFDEFVIIITGDIFHNKNNIGNHGLLLYKTFVQELTKLGRLIIFSGNHDKMQSNQEQPTLVYSSSFDIHNLTILNNTHSFVIDDIGFSYVDINDTLDIFKNSGRIQDLPPFPLFDASATIKYKIALFHGSFAAVKLYNGENVRDDTNPYPLEWIKDFDFVLLGDIHKRQVFNYKKNTICGYSGSLIQQNFGEDIIEHGYLLWNLDNKVPEEINVYNNIGYINIIEDVGHTIFIRTNGKYTEPLEEYIKKNISYFPKIIEIKSFSNINFENLNNIFKSFNISFQIVSKLSILNNIDLNNNDERTKKCDIRVDNMIDSNYLLDYFKKLLSPDKYKILNEIIKNKEFLLFDINKYPEELTVECAKRNKELTPIINSCNNLDDILHLKKSFLIKYLEWEGLLCYENKCWINFNDLDAKTFMIKGSNGTGKSAIYDILVLAIWATNNKLDTYSAGFINHNKEKAYTIIDIEIDNITYRIKRDFCKKKNTFKINNKGSVLSKFVNRGDLIMLKKDTACNTEVKLLFGDIDTFLSTSMITQNVDNDILSLNYKDTLETIDKANNIQYIYNLYNLFKTAINKYKDLRKVINSKKEVYEKLLFNDVNQHVNDDVISQLNEELSLSYASKNELLKTYNSINIDINNPLYLSILETDYQSLINDIRANNIIVPEDIYASYVDKLNHLKYSLNDDFKNLQTLAKSYSQQLEDDFGKLPSINKPCDISFIANEEKGLISYINDNDNDNDNDNENNEEEQLVVRKEELIKMKQKINNLISNKPTKVSIHQLSPDRRIDHVINDITSMYGTIDDFNKFISSNNKPHGIFNELRETVINEPITYLHYNIVIRRKEAVTDDICNIKNKIMSLENNLNNLLLKQQKITIKNTPQDFVTYKQFKTSVSIAKELKNYNIDIVDTQIADDEIIMNEYKKNIQEIDELDGEIDNYKKELHVFSSNDEYKYNPECCICCSRPWVSRIKEIEIIINTLNIKKQSLYYSKIDYDIVNKRLEENKVTRTNYHLLNAWFDYYKFKEAYDKIAKEINNIINTKNTLNNELINKDLDLKYIDNYTRYFDIYSFQLFEELSNLQSYDIYSAWENNYNDTKMIIEELEKTIHYKEVIKPRITKYIELKKCYDNWLIQEHNKNIIDAYHYNRLKQIIEVNDLYNEYQNNEKAKPLIKQKIELRELLANKNIDIKNLNDKIVKYTTINTYNDDNKNKYVVLTTIDTELETIIDVLDTILCNFQSFRKELYESFILNKLVEKTNKIIKTLCHSNTKPFKLNYNVDISNDNVHINWLIHNDNISNKHCKDEKDDKHDKQYISVSQASGFQHFVISLALRMSLYLNNYDVLCNQLFIDEGFINFDKYNLSIVPSFLKSLLHYFNTIVILSHIDIIQDSVDETANICFNHENGKSSMNYN